MRLPWHAFLLPLLACSRDLAIPAQLLPPAFSTPSSAPSSGFTGDTVHLLGHNLGNAATSQITVGGENTLILSANADGTDLTIEVPDVPSTDLGPAGVDIVVQTSSGTVTAAKGFLHLGVGHPRTLAVNTILSVALDVSRAVPLADAFALLDAGHRSITLLAQGTGAQGLTLPLAGAPFLAFGSTTSTWVGEPFTSTTSTNLRLACFNLAGPAPVAIDDLDLGPAPAEPSEYGSGSDSSPSGLFAALPGVPAAGQVLLVNVPAHTSTPFSLAANEVALGVRFVSDTTLIGWTAAHFFRVDSGGAPVSGPEIPPHAGPLPGFRAAVDGVNSRIAYLRSDGVTIGFVSFALGALPTVETSTLQPLAFSISALAWSSAGDRLLVADRVGGRVLSFYAPVSPPSFSLDNSVLLPAPVSLEPVRSGAAIGNLLAAAGGNNSALLTPDATVVRLDHASAGIRGLATQADGTLIALTNYGVATTDAISLTARSGQTIDKGTGQPVYFAGLTSSGGHPIAWTGGSVYRSQESLGQAGAYSWYLVGTGGASVLSADIEVQGTAGTVAAVVASSSGGTFGVQLWPFDAGGPASGGSSASFAGLRPALRFVGGSLFVAGGAPPVLARYQPPSLTATASTPLLAPTGFTVGRPVGVWPSGSSVLASALETYSNGSVVEFQTAWPATGPSVLARAGYASEGLIAVSPDGRAWFGLTRATGLDLQPGLAEGLYQTTANSVAIRDVGRVDLPARGGLAVPSLSGHRLYVTLPSIDAIAVIE